MKKTLITVFILLAVILRFLWLDKIPNAIGGDELNYVITAKAIAINKTDTTGTWNPLSIFAFRYPYAEGQAELEYFLIYPFVLSAFSLFNAKLIFALLSVLSVLLIYLIAKKLFDEKTAIIAGFISAINPWFIFIGRTGYEMTPALFFALLSLYILLIAKKWKILIAIPFLFCLFYSYIAIKLIFIPFILVVLVYLYFYQNKKKFLKQYLIVFFLCIGLVLFFITSLKLNPSSSRMGEIFTINNEEIAKEVNESRRLTIQNPLTNLLENKYTVYLRIATDKFLNIFSFNYLFSNSDQFVGINKHGLFYYIDVLFLLLGIIFLSSKNKKLLLFILILVFVGTLSHVFHKARTDNFSPHIFLIFPFLIMLISFGIKGLLDLFKKKQSVIIISIIVFLLYLLSLTNFLNIYFFQYPLKGNSDFHVRVLSKYVKLADKENKEIVVYTNRSFDFYKKYIFYADLYTKKNFTDIRKAVNNRSYVLGKVMFTDCTSSIDFSMKQSIVLLDSLCSTQLINEKGKHLSIPFLTDGGESLKIYNDTLCKGVNLKNYPSGLKISDFNIEELSKEDFCKTFITSL